MPGDYLMYIDTRDWSEGNHIMRLTRRFVLMIPGLGAMAAAEASTPPDYPASAVPFSEVEIRDEFWAPRIKANRAVSIWHCLDRMDRGDFGISKLIEGAAYMLAKRSDPKLETAIRG